MLKNNKRAILTGMVVLGIAAYGVPGLAAEGVATAPVQPGVSPGTAAMQALYATVNDVGISMQEFHGVYADYLRRKFYHGQVPEDKLKEAYQAVSDQLVEAILFRDEIQRRQIRPDDEEVEKKLVEYENRYAGSPNWQQTRESALPQLREHFRAQSQLARLEQTVKNLPAPSEAEVQQYYNEHTELFTEPEKLHLHAILLQIDPSSAGSVWEAARQEAAAIVKRLRGGGSFEEAARLHSGDRSAAAGGDMGYMHRGMLPEGVQQRIDKMGFGEISDPIELLEGIAIIRLDDRKSAKLREFADVRERARELLVRERQDKAWQDFRAELRRNAKIVIHRQPQPGPGG